MSSESPFRAGLKERLSLAKATLAQLWQEADAVDDRAVVGIRRAMIDLEQAYAILAED